MLPMFQKDRCLHQDIPLVSSVWILPPLRKHLAPQRPQTVAMSIEKWIPPPEPHKGSQPSVVIGDVRVVKEIEERLHRHRTPHAVPRQHDMVELPAKCLCLFSNQDDGVNDGPSQPGQPDVLVLITVLIVEHLEPLGLARHGVRQGLREHPAKGGEAFREVFEVEAYVLGRLDRALSEFTGGDALAVQENDGVRVRLVLAGLNVCPGGAVRVHDG